jgi:hypothetical protein
MNPDTSHLPNRVDDVLLYLEVVQIPVGVGVLDRLVHPPHHRSNLCGIVPGVSYQRVDRVPERVGREAATLLADPRPVQRRAEPFPSPRLSEPCTAVVAEHEIFRNETYRPGLDPMKFVDRAGRQGNQPCMVPLRRPDLAFPLPLSLSTLIYSCSP